MPSFPHTLIGLGQFADLGCKIVFTKTSVTVYHPDGHPILAGWRDETGPRLWHFPFTTEAAQVALNDASPQLPIPSPPPCAPPAAIVITPRKQRASVSTRKQTQSCNTALKQSRHTLPRRRVTFSLPPFHVNKDSTVWTPKRQVNKTQAANAGSAGGSAYSRSYSFEPGFRRDSATEQAFHR
jgi:hypothetical protein